MTTDSKYQDLIATAHCINTALNFGRDYYLEILKPGQIEPGFFIYWQDKFQKVERVYDLAKRPQNKVFIFKDGGTFEIPSNFTFIQLKKLG